MEERNGSGCALRLALERLRDRQTAAGRTQPIITLRETRGLAERTGKSLREVEIQALNQGLIPARYSRNIGTTGLDGQAKLLRSQVVVVGCGGLGGWVVEGLARMGIGRLVLVDGDCFEEDNLNRQIGCEESTLGEKKARVLEKRVGRINGAVDVRAEETLLDGSNATTLLSGADAVVDALDSLPSRLVLEDAARSVGIPLVHAAIGGFAGQVMTIYPDDPGLRALYGDDVPARGVEEYLGNPSATPMMLAAWQIHEVVKLLLGKGVLLRRRLLILDAEYGDVTQVEIG